MTAMAFGIITTIISLLGIYGWFTGHPTLVIIGGVAAIIEILIGLFSGALRSILTSVIAVVAGGFYISSLGGPFWFGALLGLCFENAIMQILGYITVFALGSKMNV